MCGCPSHPPPGTWAANRACALTGNRTGDPLVCRLALNLLNHTSQGCTIVYKGLQHPQILVSAGDLETIPSRYRGMTISLNFSNLSIQWDVLKIPFPSPNSHISSMICLDLKFSPVLVSYLPPLDWLRFSCLC